MSKKFRILRKGDTYKVESRASWLDDWYSEGTGYHGLDALEGARRLKKILEEQEKPWVVVE